MQYPTSKNKDKRRNQNRKIGTNDEPEINIHNRKSIIAFVPRCK